MSGIKLTLPSIETNIRIGQSFDEIRQIFTDIETPNTYSEDMELNRHDLSYAEHGIGFIFTAKALTTVYIYIRAENITPFKGSFGCLDESFFLKESIQYFYDLTLADNFVEWFRDYPMSTDMVKNGLRLRYWDNDRIPKKAIVYTDLTVLLRKIDLPIDKQDLVPKMMQRLEAVQLEHNLKRISEADYEKHCVRLINELNA